MYKANKQQHLVPWGPGIALFPSVSFFLFWPSHSVCGILVPRAGTESMLPGAAVQSLYHWTTRDLPLYP